MEVYTLRRTNGKQPGIYGPSVKAMPTANAHSDFQKREALAERVGKRHAETQAEIALALGRANNANKGLKRMNAKGPGVFTGAPMHPATKVVPNPKAPAPKKTVVTVSYVGGEPKTAVKR